MPLVVNESVLYIMSEGLTGYGQGDIPVLDHSENQGEWQKQT